MPDRAGIAFQKNEMNSIVRWIKNQNPKFTFMQRSFGKQAFRLLDIGAGNASATKTKSLFPDCTYYGLDLNKDYANTEADFRLMEEFYEMDLTKLEFSVLPDDFFDGIWIVHVIEHLYNGDAVIEGLLKKLKKGGYLYVEYPGQRSLSLPSMRGTLNYKDDPTHVRVYSIRELQKLFEKNNTKVIRSGFRRSLFYVSVTPARAVLRLLRGKRITGNIFWDMLGFAEYLYVRKA